MCVGGYVRPHSDMFGNFFCILLVSELLLIFPISGFCCGCTYRVGLTSSKNFLENNYRAKLLPCMKK